MVRNETIAAGRFVGGATARGRKPAGGPGTISGCVNIDSATTNAALLVGLAIFVLIAAGWRKPARATPGSHRGAFRSRAFPSVEPPSDTAVAVREVDTEGYRPPSILRRLRAIVGSTGMALALGAVLATIGGYGAAILVIKLTDLLKQ